MSTSSFEKDSFGWQLQQLQQRLEEWWELQTNELGKKIPNVPLFDSEILWKIIEIVFWTIIGLFAIWILWQVWLQLRQYLYNLGSQNSQSAQRKRRLSKELSVADWLARSQKFQQQGNYREACICLYQAMLQQLSDREIIPHQPSRTDGEYLQLIQQLPQSRPYIFLLMTHQILCFSSIEATPSILKECQQAYREIETG